MDGLKRISHKSLAVVTGTIEWLRGIYGELCTLRWKKHLGIDLNYSIRGKVVFSMEKCTKNVIAEFPEDIGKTAETPVVEYPFTVWDDNSRRPLPKEQARVFH